MHHNHHADHHLFHNKNFGLETAVPLEVIMETASEKKMAWLKLLKLGDQKLHTEMTIDHQTERQDAVCGTADSTVLPAAMKKLKIQDTYKLK